MTGPGRSAGRGSLHEGALVGLLVLISAWPASANPGLMWLASQQAPDGGYGQSATSLATSGQSTAEVLRAQLALGQSASPGFESALDYLNTRAGTDTELLARKVVVNAQLGLSAPSPASQFLARLRANQHVSGGFGARAGWRPSVFDTAVALEALALGAAPADPDAAAAVGFLLAYQQTSGAWAEGVNEPSVYLTALSMRALLAYRTTYAGVATALTRAQGFLLSRRAMDGLWGEDLRSATALLALVPCVSDLSLVDASVQSLASHQLPNGSWVDDSFTTALALQALKVYDGRKRGSSPSAGGSLSGYVLRAGSTEPVSGATVAVEQVPGVAVLTNGEGYYVLPGLPAGSYTLTAQKAGLTSASAVVVALAGQVTLAPPLVLDVLSQTGLVSGLAFDAATHQPLRAVQVSLLGAASYSVLTSSTGEFDFGPVAPGTYTLRFEKAGYITLSGAATVEAGRALSAQMGMTRVGGYVDDTPGLVSGRVLDGKTSQPITGALFDLGGGLSVTTGADGAFRLASVPRSTYQGTLSAAGYQPVTLSLIFAPGASGDVGSLLLYPRAATTPPTSLTLRGLVVDSVSSAPISHATVALTETGARVTTGADGRFILANINLKDFHLALSASGYVPASCAVQAAAYGEADVTLRLSPPGSGAASSRIEGLVTDASTSAPVSGAQVTIAGTSLTTTTSADGRYAFAEVTALDFVVNASAVGYTQQQLRVRLASHGTYTVNAALSPVAADSFHIVSLVAQQPQHGANATALFTARVASLLSADKTVLVFGEVQDSEGATVATVAPYAEGTTAPASQFSFTPGEVKTLTLPWSTAQFAPGAYRLVVRVSEPGTLSRGAPSGEVLAESSARTSITSSLAIGGALAVNPPMTQAGLLTPVSFTALVRNAGNTPLAASTYVLKVKSARTGQTLFTAEAGAGGLPVGSSATVTLGRWIPTEMGNLPVIVQATTPSVAGSLIGRLYVGDKASGTFTVSRSIVPEGDQGVRGTISMQGVDTTAGTGTDPLFTLVKESIRRAGTYTATEGVAWNRRNACLGCHIQTQSLLGLSGALGKAEVDAAATRHLFNSINTAVYPDGSSGGRGGTETALALWSLSAWGDLTQSFRTQYLSAWYLQRQKSVSGNQTSWAPSHQGGWWDTQAAQTALVVKGYVDVLKSAAKVPLQGVPDYALGVPRSLGPPGAYEGMATGPDGSLYAVRTDGTLTRLNLASGQVSTAASGLGSIRGLAIKEDGTMYVTRYGWASSIIKIKPDGTRVDIPVSGNFPSAAVGPDGWIYLPDWSYNRVVRVSPTDQVEVYARDGLLDRPCGVAFDSDGSMFIANSTPREILRLEARTRAVTRFAEGLAYQPTGLRRMADGSVYVTTSPPGLIRVRPDGTAERVVSMSTPLSSPAIAGGKLYVLDSAAVAVREVEVRALDTSGLAALRNELPAAARYLLANTERDQDNTTHAMRLIGLAEASQFITDETLRAQVGAKVSGEAMLLRSRQRADGGWPRYASSTASDPLATALAGLALEYTTPSPRDPQIRNAIQYLLNTQSADGSWGNFNNNLNTRLASTSLVMVFMPKALDRLGGIDIDLYVETPGNIQLTNATVAPTSTPGAGGAATHLWKLPGVTGAGREVRFDLRLLGMALGEQRPVARRAYLEFKNSFVEERVQLPLGIPVVSTTSGAALAVTTDEAVYLPNKPVVMPVTVTNTGQAPLSGKVALTLRAVEGIEPVAILPPLPFTSLAAGATLSLLGTWNTGATLAGSYEVQAQLLDMDDRVLARSTAPFELRAPLPVASVAVTTHKPVYEAWDTVSITGRIRNIAPNALLAPSRVEVTVRAPDGTLLFSGVQLLTQLVPGGLVDVPFGLTLADVMGGSYHVRLMLQDAFTRTPLGTGETTFQVARHLAASLTGSVTVELPQVYVGDANVCTATARSAAASPVPGVRLIHQLIDAEAGTVVDETTETVNLAAGHPHASVRNISTQSLTPSGYLCGLHAELEGTRRALGFAGFRVLEPPIKLTARLERAGKGRLLTLLDTPAGSQGPGEPFGPPGAPDLRAQRAFLEELLNRAGWSYTLTEAADEFTREFHSGGYAVYALSSEREQLAVQVQKELREAIYRGEGLLVTGSHDSRNHGNSETLGVNFTGHLGQAQLVELSAAGFPLLSGWLALLEDERPLRFGLAGAEALGSYGGEAGPRRHALALHTYGRGTAAAAGPDLLATGARDGQQGTAATLLRALLERVHPESLATRSGAVVPVQLELTNQGVAVAIAAAVALPAGTSLVDSGPGRLDGHTLRFAFPLAVGETRAVRFWVRLPELEGPVVFHAEVVAVQGSRVKSVTASLAVSAQPIEQLASLVSRLEVLGATSHPDAGAFNGAALHLRNALRRTTLTLAIKDALLATERLQGAASIEAKELRVATGTWMGWAALQQNQGDLP